MHLQNAKTVLIYCGYNEIIESKNLSKRTETVDTQRANDVPTKLTRCCVRALFIRKDWEYNNYYLTQGMQPNDHVPTMLHRYCVSTSGRIRNNYPLLYSMLVLS